MFANQFIDSLRERNEIWIKCAGDNACMSLRFLQSYEMFTIECQECAVILSSILKHIFIGPRLIGLAGFTDR